MISTALLRHSRMDDRHASSDRVAGLPGHRHADSESLAQALATAVAEELRAAIRARDKATLALSGGTTPLRFLEYLAREELDWWRVSATLVDERWVPADHARSNARLLREHLLRGPAARAHFMPLYRDTPSPEDALAAIGSDIATLLPLDVVVLGMGLDGHVASYFPGGEGTAAALDPLSASPLAVVRAAAAGEPRITLTLPVLAAGRAVHLHIEGAEKRAVLERALAGNAEDAALPVQRVLQHLQPAPTTWWCP